jgi:acetyl-CoA acetyltransferase
MLGGSDVVITRSRARVVVMLLLELQRRGKTKGLATLCVSGAMGMAMTVEVGSGKWGVGS